MAVSKVSFDNVQVLLLEHTVSTHFVKADGAIKGLDLLETITRNTAQNPKEDRVFWTWPKKPTVPREPGWIRILYIIHPFFWGA